jgi:hypothetical protein
MQPTAAVLVQQRGDNDEPKGIYQLGVRNTTLRDTRVDVVTFPSLEKLRKNV